MLIHNSCVQGDVSIKKLIYFGAFVILVFVTILILKTCTFKNNENANTPQAGNQQFTFSLKDKYDNYQDVIDEFKTLEKRYTDYTRINYKDEIVMDKAAEVFEQKERDLAEILNQFPKPSPDPMQVIQRDIDFTQESLKLSMKGLSNDIARCRKLKDYYNQLEELKVELKNNKVSVDEGNELLDYIINEAFLSNGW